MVDLEPAFNGGGGWTLNFVGGTTTFPTISGTLLTISQDVGGQANSFFFNTPMYCGAFKASFTYQDVNTAGADGFAFCLQNDPRGVAALGEGGGDHAYGGNETANADGITNSVAVNFNIYAGGTGYAGGNGMAMSFDGLQGGGDPQAGGFGPVGGGVSIRNGDQINIALNYDGNTMTVTLSDPSIPATYVTNYLIGPVSAYLGGNTALIGFTGATGGVESQQNISAFSYTPIPIMSAGMSGNNAVITWPTGIGGYVLQSCATVNGTYTAVTTGSFTIVNGNNQLVVPAGPGNTFYRLFLQ